MRTILQTPVSRVAAPFAAALLLSFAGFAQAPEIAKDIQLTKRLEGKWEGSATVIAGGQTMKGPLTWNFQPVSSGHAYLMTDTFVSKEIGTMTGTSLIGYDPVEQKFHVTTVDNMGTAHDHLARWNSPDSFHMEHNGTREGKKFSEQIDMQFKGNNQVSFTCVSTLDGKVTEKIESTLTRK